MEMTLWQGRYHSPINYTWPSCTVFEYLKFLLLCCTPLCTALFIVQMTKRLHWILGYLLLLHSSVSKLLRSPIKSRLCLCNAKHPASSARMRVQKKEESTSSWQIIIIFFPDWILRFVVSFQTGFSLLFWAQFWITQFEFSFIWISSC